jgi:Xaa-Pro aminopeptidase
MWHARTDHPMMALISADPGREPVVVVPEFLEGAARASTWFEHVRWPRRGPTYGDTLAVALDVIGEMGHTGGRIGLELGFGQPLTLGYQRFNELRAGLPKAELVDAMEVFLDVRRIKSEREIETIKAACDITCHAYEAGFKAARPGMTEDELNRIITSDMYAQGAEMHQLCISSSATGYCVADGLPSNYPLEGGTFLWLDGGAGYKGYWADCCRMLMFGPADERHRRWFEASLAANHAAHEAIVPGGRVGAAMDAAEVELDRLGLGQYRIGDLIGHGLGMEPHEPPYLSRGFRSGDDQTFEPGMVVTIEVSMSDPGAWEKGRYAIEDSFAVTRDGREQLTAGLSTEVWQA